MTSYYEYAKRIAKNCEIAEGNEKRQAAALKEKKIQMRKAMQAEYDAIAAWTSAQIKEFGLNSGALNESAKKIAVLDDLISALV
jgi:hypothetical protein